MELTIRKPAAEEFSALCALWTQAFGDSAEYAAFALSRLRPEQYALCGYFEGKLAGMLFLLPGRITLAGLTADACYLYGVATAPEFRGRGVMRTLEGAAAAFLRQDGVAAILLVPAADRLFAMYQKLGYRTRFYLGKTRLAPAAQPRATLFDCTREEFKAMRQAMLLKHSSRMELDDRLCDYRYEELLFSKASILRAETGWGTGYLVCRQEKDGCCILETDLTGYPLAHAAGELAKRNQSRHILQIGAGGGRCPYGMVKLLDNQLDRTALYTADPYMNLMLN